MKVKQSRIKIVLTGGHAATTALSVVEELKKRTGKKIIWDAYWIGTSRAFEGRKIQSIESKVLPKYGVKFRKIITGRIQRKFTIWTIPSLIKIPVGFIQAFFEILKIKPKIVLSFGGFASFPVVVSSWFLRVPIVIHEQTSKAGRANRLSSFFADKILVARQGSLKYFPEGKTKVIGNPILPGVEKIKIKASLSSIPVIYITGGSRGSVSLNTLFYDVMEKLLRNYKIIHQTGFVDFDKFLKLKKSFSRNISLRYEVVPEIEPAKVLEVLKKTDLVISRAGANTVAEIMAAKRPAILIPLPFSYLSEQLGNALYAEKFGIAQVLDQKKLSGEKLKDKIEYVLRNWETIVENIKDKKSPDLKASQKLVDILEENIK